VDAGVAFWGAAGAAVALGALAVALLRWWQRRRAGAAAALSAAHARVRRRARQERGAFEQKNPLQRRGRA
jgi:hypothetical protein